MKNTFARTLAAVIALMMIFCISVANAEEAEPETKLYTVTLTFDPSVIQDVEVKGVGIKGEFLFYESNMTGHTDETGMADGVEKYYPPCEYKTGLASIGGLYYEDMTLNADGIYEITFDLPAGVYPYTFVINPELGPEDEAMSWSNVTTKTGEKRGFVNIMDSLILGNQAKVNRFIQDPKNLPWPRLCPGPSRTVN